MDADFSVTEAMAFRGNEIIAVGRDTDVRSAVDGNATEIDLYGQTVMPGFIDAYAAS